MTRAPFLLVLAVLLGMLAGPVQAQAPVFQNRAPVPAIPAPAALPTAAGIDRLFAVAVMQGHAAEMDMADLALRRGRADEVRGYAAKMMAEHRGLMAEMSPVLRRVLRGAAVQPRLAAPDALALHHLAAVPPADFDQLYLLQQIGDHLAALSAFLTEVDNGADGPLKMIARKWTPTVQAHLELAVDLSRHVGGESPFKSP